MMKSSLTEKDREPLISILHGLNQIPCIQGIGREKESSYELASRLYTILKESSSNGH